MIELNIPYPPSANRLWRVGRGRVFKSAEYNKWLADAGIIARSQKPGRINGPYKIYINAVRPDRRLRDLGNLEKPVSDLMQGIGVVKNDCHAEMIVSRWVTNGEGVHVRIEPAGVE